MYEITFITREEKDPVVKKTIESFGGKIISEQFLGRKKFTYPIKKEEAGFYICYTFEIDAQKLPEINKTLSLKPEILRNLVTVKKTLKAKSQKTVKKEITENAIMEMEKTKENEIEIPETPTKEKEADRIIKEKTTFIKPVKETEIKSILETKSPLEKEKIEKPITKKEKIAKPKEKAGLSEKDLGEEERLKALEERLEEILKE